MTKTKVRQTKTANRKAMLQTESMLAEMDRIREAPASDDWFMIEQDTRSCTAVIVRNAIKSTGNPPRRARGRQHQGAHDNPWQRRTAASRTSITAWGAVAAGQGGSGRPGYRSGGRMMLADAVRAAKEAGAAALTSSLNAQAARLQTPEPAGSPLRQALLRVERDDQRRAGAPGTMGRAREGQKPTTPVTPKIPPRSKASGTRTPRRAPWVSGARPGAKPAKNFNFSKPEEADDGKRPPQQEQRRRYEPAGTRGGEVGRGNKTTRTGCFGRKTKSSAGTGTSFLIPPEGMTAAAGGQELRGLLAKAKAALLEAFKGTPGPESLNWLLTREARCSAAIESEFDEARIDLHYHALQRMLEQPAGTESLLECHQTMMEGQKHAQPGGYRTVNIQVGRHIAPEHRRVPELMAGLFRYLALTEDQPLVAAAWAHIQFETIHPVCRRETDGLAGRS